MQFTFVCCVIKHFIIDVYKIGAKAGDISESHYLFGYREDVERLVLDLQYNFEMKTQKETTYVKVQILQFCFGLNLNLLISWLAERR